MHRRDLVALWPGGQIATLRRALHDIGRQSGCDTGRPRAVIASFQISMTDT